MAGLLELLIAELRVNPEGARELAEELAELVYELTGSRATEALLTVQQAADRAHVSEKTIRRRIDRGELPAIRIGTSVRVQAAELEQYLENARRVDPPPALSTLRRSRSRSNLVAAAFRELDA